jgi:hypothetical protein
MNVDRKHLFHMVDPSPLPFATAIGGFFLTSGLAFYMHRITGGFAVFVFGLFLLLLVGFT